MHPQAAAVPLAAGFPTPSLDTWRALVDKALAGASFEERLVARTEDGLRVEPLYTAADAVHGVPRPWRARPAWDIRALVDAPLPIEANRAGLAELKGGATSLLVALGDHGVAIRGSDDLRAVLEGVHLTMATLALDPGAAWHEAATWVDTVVPADALPVELGADPLAHGQDAAEIAPLVAPGRIVARADGRVWHDRGATDAQELAAVLATGVAYLRALDGAAAQVALTVAVEADVFGGIAKLRALRRCWRRVLDACALEGPVRIHAQTSARMLTRRDPYTNLLRNTAACFAAGLGGADAVTVLPHDHALRPGDAFSRRIARNVGLILMEEANLHRVADPAGGSWYVERRTSDLARAAWSLFQAIETGGGIGSGLLAEQVAAAAEARERRIAAGERVIVGTTRFVADEPGPIPDRGLPVRRDAARSEGGA